MPHDISRMAYVGEEPWHGLGVRLPRNAPYDDIVAAAGFHEAKETDIYLPGHIQPVPDKKAIVRGDTGDYLSAVGRTYHVVQFAAVARTLVEAAGEVRAIFHTAGTLGRAGIRGWLLGELPEPIKVRGDPSPIRKYLLGTTGHDGCTAVTLKNVATRVVCRAAGSDPEGPCRNYWPRGAPMARATRRCRWRRWRRPGSSRPCVASVPASLRAIRSRTLGGADSSGCPSRTGKPPTRWGPPWTGAPPSN